MTHVLVLPLSAPKPELSSHFIVKYKLQNKQDIKKKNTSRQNVLIYNDVFLKHVWLC